MKTQLLIFVLAGVLSAAPPLAKSQSYNFTTIAGLVGANGAVDGTNSDARFSFPAGLAIDGAGVLYVADLLNHSIRRIAPSGTNWIVTTVAGLAPTHGFADGTNSQARFDHPTGIAVDSAGNLFVADKYNDVIRRITPAGTNWVVDTIAGSPGIQDSDDGTNDVAHFYGPSGIAADSFGRLFVVDSSNFTIRQIVRESTNWIVTTIAGTPLAYGFQDGANEIAEFNYPYSVAIGPESKLYVTDWGNESIRQISANAPDWFTDTVAGFSGNPGTNDGSGLTADFNSPTGITVDAQTNLFVTDYGSHTIRKIARGTSGWTVSTIGGVAMQFGSTDGVGSTARFFRPWGVVKDPDGNLFVADYRNQTIRKGTPILPPRPAIQMAWFANQLILSWPSTASNYVLETSSTVNDTSWMVVTNKVVLQGNMFISTNSITSTNAFYRLHRN